MKVEAVTDFKHGRMQFENGLSYTVPDAIGAYFIEQKWAKTAAADAKCFTVGEHQLGADAEPAKRSSDSLDIHDMQVKGEIK